MLAGIEPPRKWAAPVRLTDVIRAALGEVEDYQRVAVRGVGFRLEGAPTAPREQHSLSPQKFTWSGGDPVASSDGTPTGIRTCGKGNGFTISAPAGTSTRTLRLYVGAFAGRGRQALGQPEDFLQRLDGRGEAGGAQPVDQRRGRHDFLPSPAIRRFLRPSRSVAFIL